MVDYKLELYSVIETIIRDENNENGINGIDWSPEAISAFTNLLISQISTKGGDKDVYFYILGITAGDIESFARHAKRSTINQDDVKLLTRRNETVEKEILEFIHFKGEISK